MLKIVKIKMHKNRFFLQVANEKKLAKNLIGLLLYNFIHSSIHSKNKNHCGK